MNKKSDFLIRGIILLSIFLIFSFFDTQAHSIPLKPDIESNQSPKRLMGLEKKVNPVTSRIINSKPEDNAETISSALLCPKKNNPEKNHSSNTVIKTAAALVKEIGIPSSYFDTNRILQITNDKLHVVIGFHSSFILDYSDYKSYVLESNLKIVRALPEINAIVVEVDISALKLFLNSWNNLPFIRYLELAQITSVSAITDDPDWDIQYGPQIIQTDLAWDIQKGDPSTVLIAVIDTGIDYTHPDLADQYITGGYDYVNNDWDPMDDHSHGTHCAGTIGATINNSIGIAGVANVSIMGYKVFNSGGFGFDYDAADAIINATNFGADILSNSYGFPSSNPVLADAVAYAAVHDVVIVVSAGNSGTPVSSYPALYPETITVSATDDSDTPASFTSYGSAVDVAAPGVDIWSTLPVSMGNYGYKSGTSMACPHVAGVCALIRAQFPSFTADQVRQHLRMSADDLGSIGWDDYYGYGRVNAFKAVQPPPQHELVTYLHGNPEAILPGETIKLNISVYNYGQENETDIQLQLWINDTLIEEKTFTTLNVGDIGSFSYSWSPSLLGTYNISVYASPVLDETYTANNRIIKYVYVRYPIISYDLGDFIEMNFVSNGTPILNFTYTTEIDPTHIRIDFGNGYDWFIVNTLTRYISSGTTWVGYYYMGQIETGLKIGDSVKWYATTGIVNNTVYYNWDGMLLEAWNLTIAEGVFAYYHKTTGIWLYYNKFGTEIEMVNTSFIVWQPPEHELRASLRAPGIIPVNNATFVNVTVYNEGRNNETNVEVQLWINDSMESSQIFLSVNSGTEVTLSYSWRPLLNGVYNITAYVIPVVNETLLFNNFETIFSLVQEPSDYLIIQDANPWNFDWTTLLGIIGITYDIVPSNSFGAMNLSFYGRIIIPSDQPQEFYTQIENQMSILEGFVQQGGILEVHATDQGENEGMWEGFLPNGISYISVESNSIEVEDPSNLLLFHPYVITKYDLNAWGPAVGGYLANIGNANVILTSLSQPIMIELAVGEGYYLITTQTLELGYSYAESRFFENLLQYNPAPPPHEIGVGLECASLLPNGTSVLLNATLANHGISTEANVYLEIWINDTLYVNNSYPSLIGMSTELVQYEWNPIKTGFYNITVFAPPVIGEVTTLNNYLEASCLVKYLVNYTLYETEFGWFDAYANGYNTNLTGDDTYYALNLPFPFFYYDVNFTSIYISSNGWFSFTDSSPTTFSNPTFPTASFPYAIAVFWDDLQAQENVYIWNTTSFVAIEYHNYSTLGGSVIGNFELILFENGTILMQYQNILLDFGATIGLNYGEDQSYYSAYTKGISGVSELRLLFTSKPLKRHDLTTEIEAPTGILYDEIMLIVINASVHNAGTYDENDIAFELWVNYTLVLQEIIPSLLVGESTTFSYEWIPTTRGDYNITSVALPVENETFTVNNRETRTGVIDDPRLNFSLGDYIDFYFTMGGDPSPYATFTYISMLDLVHVYVEVIILGGMGTEWISINIVNRLIEDGSIWVGMYAFHHIETDIALGDTVKWMEGDGTVTGTVWHAWNGATLEAWNISLNEPSSSYYAYYDKISGVILYLKDTESGISMFIVDTTMIELYAPIISSVYPSSGDFVTGVITITWTATDPDNGTLHYTLNYWNGTEWINLETGQLTSVYIWDTTVLADGDFYRLQLIVSDGYFSQENITATSFTVTNQAEPPTVHLLYPNGGEVLNGQVIISWSATDPQSITLNFILYYWDGDDWILIASNIGNSYYNWDTTTVEDGNSYSIRIIASNGILSAEDQSNSSFTINNPNAPIVQLGYPIEEGPYNGTIIITWIATDLDGDILIFTLYYWNSTSWVEIESGITGTSYQWDSTTVTDGEDYLIRIVGTDGSLTGESQSVVPFIINNPDPPTVQLLTPQTEGPFNETILITWNANDLDNETLIYTLSYWDGSNWIEIITGLTSESYTWNVSTLPNGDHYQLRIVASDGTLTCEAISSTTFEIYNESFTSSSNLTTNPITTSTSSSTSLPATTRPKPSIGFETLIGILITGLLGSFRISKRRKRR